MPRINEYEKNPPSDESCVLFADLDLNRGQNQSGQEASSENKKDDYSNVGVIHMATNLLWKDKRPINHCPR